MKTPFLSSIHRFPSLSLNDESMTKIRHFLTFLSCSSLRISYLIFKFLFKFSKGNNVPFLAISKFKILE